MLPEEKDAALLWDMLQAAIEIVQFVEGVKYSDFESNKMLRYAIERQVLVIGEAAKKVSDVFKSSYPQIPWTAIVGQRNVLAHEYGEVLIERIWRVTTVFVPELIKLLTPLVPEPPE
jgi:uncharacterized protein with HEPN domain